MVGWFKYLTASLLLMTLLIMAHSVGNLNCLNNLPTDRTITARSFKIDVAIAATPADQIKGLSDQSCIGSHEGMLFVFNQAGPHSFWMRSMQFPLDMIWLDPSGKVVDMKTDIQPATYPAVFTNAAPASYVLELPAGQAAKIGLCDGNQIEF